MNIVAEIGCNHGGDVAVAKKMIKAAADAGATHVKSQKRHIPTQAARFPELYRGPHPVEANAFGKTYREHREALELTVDEHLELWEYADFLGIRYFVSAWDPESAEEMVWMDMVKVPSACNLDLEIYDILHDNGQRAHISMGMTTTTERDYLIRTLESRYSTDWVLYACTSGYPVPFDQVRLEEVAELMDLWDGPVGFSGHHNGIAIDPLAAYQGATWIERHFTLDRTMKGTDHAASLEPSGLAKLVRNLKACEQALGTRPAGLLEIEEPQRAKLKYIPEGGK